MKKWFKENKFKIIFGIIIIIAILVRIAYVIEIPYTEKQHDIYKGNNNDGLSYILQLYEKGTLPEDNEYQHYHPPLSQILSAIWLKAGSIITQDIDMLFESLQFLNVIYSICLIFIVYDILKELKIKDKVKILVLLVMAFHPTLIILSGSINNDNLCFVLMVWTILRLIKWYKKPNMKNIIFLAITTGLSVMTKTTGAILALPIMYIFLFKLYKEIRKASDKKTIIKNYIFMFIIFGLISLPIGLWYNVRNYILFKQPILYVVDANNPELDVSNYSLLQRFMPISKEIFNIYCNVWEDYNIPIYLIKCSLFGEFVWAKGFIFEILYYIAIITNIIFVIMTMICMVKELITKNKRNKIWVNALFLLFIFNIISFISVNIKLPYGCTMDFRYLLATLFSGVMFICFSLNKCNTHKSIILILNLLLFVSSDIIILCSQ